MTEVTGKKNNITADLTERQLHLLNETLNQVEMKLFLGTLKRLRIYIALTVGVLTVFGALTLTGIRSDAVEAIALKIAGNTDVKRQVIEEATNRIETATGLIKKSQELATSLEKENARLAITLTTKLEEIHGMLAQIKEDLKDLDAKTDGL